jgi:hypothetical protein
MKSLTPDKALSGECGFMAANLYAKSIFGEDALANVSLEKNPAKPDATVTGHIRIRAKSQGKYRGSSINAISTNAVFSAVSSEVFSNAYPRTSFKY